MKNAGHIDSLIERLEKKFVDKVTIKNSYQLAELISDKTKLQISATTIQRLFKLIKNNSFPSKNTLNVIAKFLDFNSFEDYIEKGTYSYLLKNKHKLNLDNSSLVLLELCLKNQNVSTIVEFLEKLDDSIESDFSYRLHLSNLLGLSVRNDKKLRSLLLPMLAKSKIGRIVFYETIAS